MQTRTHYSSSRPTSQIPTFSKVIEKHVLTRLQRHVSITPQQHGLALPDYYIAIRFIA